MDTCISIMYDRPASWLHRSVCLCRIRCSCTSIAGVILGLLCPAQCHSAQHCGSYLNKTLVHVTPVPEVLRFRCCLRPYCSQVADAAACSGLSSCLFDTRQVGGTCLHLCTVFDSHGAGTPEGPKHVQCCRLNGDERICLRAECTAKL